MTILVTGATGQVGGAALRVLGADVPVRILVRDAGEWSRNVAQQRLATTPHVAPTLPAVFAGSFDDATSLRAALDGVSTLFLTGRDNPAQVEQHLRVLEIAHEAGVEHVVKLSAIGARMDSPVALMRWHAAIEAALRESSFAWTFLRPHLYMQNLLRFAGDVAGGGRLAAPMGAARFPLVDTRDVGEAVAAVLREPAAHAGRTFALTGPEALSYDAVAAQLAALIDAPVAYDALAPGAFRDGLLAAGLPAWRADDLAAIADAYTAADNAPTTDLGALLGRPATAFARFLDDHRETYLAGSSRSHL